MTDQDDPPETRAGLSPVHQRKAQERAARVARLAERLRANLGRRKQQVRARRQGQAVSDNEPEPQG